MVMISARKITKNKKNNLYQKKVSKKFFYCVF